MIHSFTGHRVQRTTPFLPRLNFPARDSTLNKYLSHGNHISLQCPLCTSSNSSIVAEIPSKAITKAYRQTVGVVLKVDFPDQVLLAKCHSCDLKYFHPMMTGDESFYEALQKYEWYYLSEKEEFQVASAQIYPTDEVLEIGAGRGAFLEKIKCKSYVGLEFSEAAVAMAQNKGIEVRKESLTCHLTQNLQRYDVVCAFQVLEHVKDVRGFLDAAVGCLKPQGKLIISVPSDDGFLGAEMSNILNMPPHHVTRWTDRCLHNVSSILALEVLHVYHGQLEDLHIRPYSITLVQAALRNMFGMDSRFLDKRLSILPVRLFVKALTLFVEQGLKDRHLRPRGHSVTIVYRKP